MICLDVINLHKYYGSFKAVNGVSFKVKKGSCFGLLGPNGAGKSTVIEVLEGIKEPTQGTILFNQKPRNSDYKEKIGIQFQKTALQDRMRVYEALKTFASFYKKHQSLENIIRICELENILHQDHKFLSGGERKRLLLGLSLINDPELLFLDEPTADLDPVARKNFWNLINNIKNQGKTIILTTHHMDEAQTLCDELVIVDEGKLIEEGNPQDLLNKYFKGVRILFPVSYRKDLKALSPFFIRETSSYLEYNATEIDVFLKKLMDNKISIKSMRMHPYNLEDLFIQLAGKGLND